MSVIRVGFILEQLSWIGGVNYFLNLFSAIKSLPNAKIKPILFVGTKVDVSQFEGMVEVVRTKILDRYSLAWWSSKFLQRTFIARDYLTYLLLRKYNIDCVSHYAELWSGCKIPFMGWIPDFQHLHLPHFFTEKELLKRDLAFRKQIKCCNAVLLSSQDALSDLEKFSPNHSTPAYVLRFTPRLPENEDVPSHLEITERYKLDRPWFHLPNQFWAHKNHAVVIEALHVLKQQGVNVLVVTTGSTDDYRNSNHFPALMKLVYEYGLEDDFLVLGVLPYVDMLAIFKHSIAIINPSLFEGWSTTVEESKAIGKKVILSDIAVHREQNPHRAVYFNPNNPEQLAVIIANATVDYDEEDELIFQARSGELVEKNVLVFAGQYQEIVLKLLS